MLEVISIALRAIIVYWITYGNREIADELAFRLPFLLQMIPALMVGIGIQFFPISPKWLAMQHHDADSLKSLQQLWRLPSTDCRVQQEGKGILSKVEFRESVLIREHGATINIASLSSGSGVIFSGQMLAPYSGGTCYSILR